MIVSILGQVLAAPPTVQPLQNICDLDYKVMFCNCDDADHATDVTCFATSHNSTVDNPVWDSFANQNKISILKLSAYNGRQFNYFPARILSHLSESLTRLTISQLNFTTLPSGAIKQMPKLEEIDFNLCEHMSIERDAFQTLPRLKKITFSQSNLATMVDMFEDVPRLEEIYLENNHISAIEPKAFSALGFLKYLYLEQNEIQHIVRDTFVGLATLHELNMNRNRLKYLPPFVFSEMRKLTQIELSSNEIAMIDADAFTGLPNLQVVKLDKNRLRTFPAGGVFSGSRQLAVVDIGFNEFEYLSWQVFYQPADKRYIRMRIKGMSFYIYIFKNSEIAF